MAERKDILKDKDFIKWLAASLDEKVVQDMYRFYLIGISSGQIQMLVAMNKLQGEEKDA